MITSKMKILISIFYKYKPKRNGKWKNIYIMENDNWNFYHKYFIKKKKNFIKFAERDNYIYEIKKG